MKVSSIIILSSTTYGGMCKKHLRISQSFPTDSVTCDSMILTILERVIVEEFFKYLLFISQHIIKLWIHRSKMV